MKYGEKMKNRLILIFNLHLGCETPHSNFELID